MRRTLIARKNSHTHSYTETVYLHLDGAWIALRRCPRRDTGYDMGPHTFPCNAIAMPWSGETLGRVAAPPKDATIIAAEDLAHQGFSADYLRKLLKNGKSSNAAAQ